MASALQIRTVLLLIGVSMRFSLRAIAPSMIALALLSHSAPAQQSAIRIAYVNPQALFEAAPGRADAEAAFRKETENYRAELNKMNESLSQLVSDYQKTESKLTAPEKERRQRAIQSKEDTLRTRQAELEQTASRRQNDLIAPIMEQVRQALEDIRSEDGYARLPSREPGSSPI